MSLQTPTIDAAAASNEPKPSHVPPAPDLAHVTQASHVDTPEAALQRIVTLFNHLQPADVSRLAAFYTRDAHFKDPFNEVQGVPAIAHIFQHMFDTLHEPRFVVTQVVSQGSASRNTDVHAFVTWNFLFALKNTAGNTPITVRGATHFVLRQEDNVWRIAVHRDYWDAAEELYEKLPVLGSLMRWLKRRVNS